MTGPIAFRTNPRGYYHIIGTAATAILSSVYYAISFQEDTVLKWVMPFLGILIGYFLAFKPVQNLIVYPVKIRLEKEGIYYLLKQDYQLIYWDDIVNLRVIDVDDDGKSHHLHVYHKNEGLTLILLEGLYKVPDLVFSVIKHEWENHRTQFRT